MNNRFKFPAENVTEVNSACAELDEGGVPLGREGSKIQGRILLASGKKSHFTKKNSKII